MAAWWFWPQPPTGDARGLVISDAEWAVPVGPRTGKDYALLIATNEYKKWPKLNNPTQDAEAIAQRLRDSYGFTVDRVINPPREELLKKLQELTTPNRFGPEDQVLIFIAGHGDRLNKEGYVVTRDSGNAEIDPTRGSMIPHSQVKDLAEKIDCGHVLVVLDVCFGGTFDFTTAVATPMRGGTYEKVSKEEFIERKMELRSALWITSGANNPVADGEPGEHSPFARQMIEALDGKGGPDGIVTFHDLLVAVQQSRACNPRDGYLRGHEAGGDFLLISR
jgi:uncharacterized caspase-like protein